MARPALPRRTGALANLTPMIDVVFQLIVFFMLVARFSEQQALDLILPRVGDERPRLMEAETRAIVNIVPRERVRALGGAYRLGLLAFPETPEGVRALAAALAERRSRQPAVEVFVRASRTEPYSRVHPVVQAVTLSGIRRVHLVTLPDGVNSVIGGEP